MELTRNQHLEWAKARSIELLEKGQIAEGMASFTSDLSKHPEATEIVKNPLYHPIIMQALMTNDAKQCIAAVDGFN